MSASDSRSTRSSSSSNSRPQSPAVQLPRLVSVPASPATSRSTSPASVAPRPRSRPASQTSSPETRELRRKLRLCFYCGSNEHLVPACPTAPPRATMPRPTVPRIPSSTKRTLSDADRHERRKLGLCFYCGIKGHLIRDCAERPPVKKAAPPAKVAPRKSSPKRQFATIGVQATSLDSAPETRAPAASEPSPAMLSRVTQVMTRMVPYCTQIVQDTDPAFSQFLRHEVESLLQGLIQVCISDLQTIPSTSTAAPVPTVTSPAPDASTPASPAVPPVPAPVSPVPEPIPASIPTPLDPVVPERLLGAAEAQANASRTLVDFLHRKSRPAQSQSIPEGPPEAAQPEVSSTTPASSPPLVLAKPDRLGKLTASPQLGGKGTPRRKQSRPLARILVKTR